MFVLSVYAQLVALIPLWAIRTAAIFYERSAFKRNVFKPFDFFCASDSRKESFPDPPTILLGKTLWNFPFRCEYSFLPYETFSTRLHQHFYIRRGETRVVRWLHRFCAISSLVGLLVFFVYATIFNPVHQVSLTPTRNYRTPSTPDTFEPTSPVWSILVVSELQC